MRLTPWPSVDVDFFATFHALCVEYVEVSVADSKWKAVLFVVKAYYMVAEGVQHGHYDVAVMGYMT